MIRSPKSLIPYRATLAVVLLWFSAAAGAAEWASVNPLPTGNNIQDVIWDNSAAQYVAVGVGGLVMTSPDGANWTLQPTPTVQRLQKVIRGGSGYVAVGEGGAVLTSPDGSVWTARSTNTRLTLYDVAWNGTVYVAVGAAGTILTSGNGTTWTEQTLLPGPAFHGVLWTTINGGQFVAVGSSLGIVTSPDGMTWTERSYNFGDVELRDIAEGGATPTLVAVGEGFAVFTSSDAVTWTPRNTPVPAPVSADPNRILGLYGLTYDGSQFVAVGSADDVNTPTDPNSVILTSTDAINWASTNNSGTQNMLRSVATSGAASYLLAGAGVLKSASSVTGPWTDVTQGSTANLAAITRYGQYVTVGTTGTILSSSDGLTWVDRTDALVTTANLYGVAANTSIYVAVGDAGTVVRSTDAAATWLPAASVPVATALYDVAWSSTYSLFIAVGAGGVILTSSDGSTWNTASSPVADDLRSVTTLHTPYVIAGAAGTILTSSDGTSWIKFTGATTTNDLYDVTWTGSNFVAVGSAGTVLRSSDGVSSWPSINIFSVGDGAATATLRSVAANGLQEGNGGQIVVVGDAAPLTMTSTAPSATIISSWLTASNTTTGAAFWKRQKTFSAPNLAGIAWDGSEFRAIGVGGAILRTGGIDISVDITALDHPSELVRVNDPYNYTFSVANVGNLNSNDIAFNHVVPSNLLLGDVQAVSFQPGTTGLCLKAGSTITCNNMIITAGDPATSVNITTTAATTGAMTLTGAVAKPGETNTGNNFKSYDDTILAEIPPTPPKTVHSGAADLWLLTALAVCLLFQCRTAARRGLRRTR